MRKILVISYFYPPLGGVGIIRTLKFTKHLPKFGWSPHVLTIKNRDYFYTSLGHDNIPSQVSVHRSWNILNNLSIFEGGIRRLKINSQILVPDAYCGWIPMTIKSGVKIIKSEKIDLIYASCPPFSSALIGMKLKKQTGLPLVIDLRDAWTLNPYSGHYLLPFIKKLDERFERQVLDSANFIITATEGIKNDYVKKYPSIQYKIKYILNGFDNSDIPTNITPFNKFTILYTGFFYGARTPELFFEALNKILESGRIPNDKIQFLWAGPNAPFVFDLSKEYNIDRNIKYIGLISKKDADKLIYQSHLLYFIIGNTENETYNTTLTGKIFPYLASGKPILAEIPSGAASDMINKYSNNSYIISSGNSDEIANAIVQCYTNWNSGIETPILSEKTLEFRKEYNFENLSQKLSEILNNVLSDRKEAVDGNRTH